MSTDVQGNNPGEGPIYVWYHVRIVNADEHNRRAVSPPSTWPTGTINSCVCSYVWWERPIPQTMAEPTLWSFDDQRLKRLFGCLGWKWPSDWCINIITPDKRHLRTHPHSTFGMDFKVTDTAVATQPYYLEYCGALCSKEKEMKNRKRNWAQSIGQTRPAERRRADTDISEDVKGGQTSGCAAGNYCVRYCTSCVCN